MKTRFLILMIVIIVILFVLSYLEWGTGTPSQLHCIFNTCGVELGVRTVYLEPELKLISKSFAIFYAAEERGWTEEDFTTYDSHAILLKIKNDSFVFEVDPNTLKEKELHMNRFNEYDEDQYVWLVSLTENKKYEYHIDAITGKILLAAKEGSVVER